MICNRTYNDTNIINNYNHYQFGKSKTTLSIVLKIHISKRHMLNRSAYAARAAYHCLKTITSNSVLDDTTKKNKKPLIEEVANLSLDHQKGLPQHKTTLLKHIINDKFPIEDYYHIKKLQEWPQIQFEPNVTIDFRVLNELPVVEEYLHQFNSSVEKLLVTGDSLPGEFSHQKQSNQDFWVTIKTIADRSMGLGIKHIPHDEKSGKGMFTHTTRGTLGLITYDNNTPIPFTTGNMDLLRYNLDRLDSIHATLDPTLQKNTKLLFNDFKSRLNALNENDHQKIILLNDEIQNALWNSLHCNPSYSRSISFVFTKNMQYEPLSPSEQAFADKFISLLGDKFYSLDKTGDRRLIFRAMLIAYKETIDPQVISKLEYLQKGIEIGFNIHFLQDMANFIKTGWTI